MPLTLPDVPVRGENMIVENVGRLFSPEEKALEVGPPFPLYSADLLDVLAGSIVENARQTAWMYLVFKERVAEGWGEVAFRDDALDATNYRYAGFHGPMFARSFVQTVSIAEDMATVAGLKYEARVLRIPPLYLVALWLFREDNSWFIPAQPTPGTLEPNRVYREGGLLDVLQPFAVNRANPPDVEP